jgi:hypothetical protein
LTGRYRHEWGVIGLFGPGQGEVAECQFCGLVREYSRPFALPERQFKDREAARSRGLTFFEGY